MFIFKIYFVGKTGETDRLIKELEEALHQAHPNEYCLEVVDLLENPQLAEDDKIFATPTLVKLLPEPVRRIIGNFSNVQKVLVGLNIQEK